MENKERKYTYLLQIVLVVSVVLRFWAFWDIPFMHDELSAMSRLQFDSFSDLIRYGVVLNDTHPAGVQVFLYYWVMWVGEREIWVKLPFLLAGVASVFLVFKIFKLWFDSVTGLLAASMVGTLQFFIMYSQIARPYSSGLFLTLMMVYYWSKYFFDEPKNRHLVLFVVFGALSAYNHHFSLLFAAIVGLSGVFFIKKDQLFAYALAGIGIFVLYLPHLTIFFYQAEQGGIGGVGGWLAKPSPQFVINFFTWLMHFSYFSGAVAIGVMAYLIFSKGKWSSCGQPLKKRFVLLLWFILPLIIGYLYSIKVNPILQFSLLIFGTPYLFGFVFSFHKKMKMIQITVLVFLIIFVNSFTLVFERDYYRIFYNQPYDEFFRIAANEQAQQDIFLIDNSIPYIHAYYFRKYGIDIPYFTKRNRELTMVDFNEQIRRIKQSVVVTQSLTGEELQVVKSYFPKVVSYHQGFTYETYVLSRDSMSQSVDTDTLIAFYNSKRVVGNFKVNAKLRAYDTIYDTESLVMTPEMEWGFSLPILLDTVIDDRFVQLDAKLYITPIESLGRAVLAGYVTEGDSVIHWSSVPFEQYLMKNDKSVTVYITLDMQGILKSCKSFKGIRAHFQVWNNHTEGNFIIDSMRVVLREGNPERYSLYYR